MTSVSELPPIPVSAHVRSAPTIRLFELSLNDVTVELSSLGASITKVMLPEYSRISTTPGGRTSRDDVVLSYASPKDQSDDLNKPFFGAIVGRVANRIKDGRFQLIQTRQSSIDDTAETLETYQLEKNNSPNHLHGGFNGFWNRIWDANVVNGAVQFKLVSQDGDQGYPGGVEVTATYSLVRLENEGKGIEGAKLCLGMHASLLPGETKATPIALAQHSYFNLASHSSPSRILEHTLHLPNCTTFTPLDNTSVPTREVQRVDHSGTKAMDFRKEKCLADALIQYGEERSGLEKSAAMKNVYRILNTEAINDNGTRGHVARTPKNGEAPAVNLEGDSPYGFDHNYAIDMAGCSSIGESSLCLAAILSHPPTGRSLRVLTSAPGMQLYTSNHLDGMTPSQALCKEGSRYFQWQGICLETQTYPDSILSDDYADVNPEFAKGRCFILRPGESDYYHDVQYEFCSTRSE